MRNRNRPADRAARRPGARVAVLAVTLAVTLAGLAPAPAAGGGEDGVLRIHNPADPPQGTETLTLDELWRRGGEDDEVFFGFIRQVLADEEGNVHVLDQQMAHVEVFSPAGEHLRTLCREGDGPGELRRPEDMVFLPDGTLGIALYFAGLVVKVDREGTPAGTLMPPGFDPEAGGRGSIRRVRCRGGNLVFNGARLSPTDVGIRRTQYVAAMGPDGSEAARYAEMSLSTDLFTDGWDEERQYFPESELWAVGSDGRVYLAAARDAYEITVHRPDGAVDRIIEGHHVPWRRTDDEKREIAESVVVIRAGQRVQIPVRVGNLAPAVAELFVDDEGMLWVLPSSGMHGQPPGVMQTYDVFDPEGNLVRKVAVACPGDPREDRLVFFAPGRAALIRGAADARQNMYGRGEDDGEAEPPDHDLTVYAY